MISFNNLGNAGRLGNQMFQYAAVKGIACRKRYWYSVPDNNELFECFKIDKTLPNNNIDAVYGMDVMDRKKVKAMCIDKVEFDQKFFDECPDDIDIVGFFQSEKYFKHIEHEIRKDFTFHDRISSICNHYMKSVYSGTEVISLHVRRSDYLTNCNFFNLTLDYYFDALKKLPCLPVIVFSDDLEWCQEIFKEKRFNVSLSKNSFIDLCLMSLCDYHIIANSSFSWWGSWLANSKQTIAPSKWFSEDFSSWDTKDLYLPNWIVV